MSDADASADDPSADTCVTEGRVMAPPWTVSPVIVADYADCVALWRDTENIGDIHSRAAFTAFVTRNQGFPQIARADGRVVGVLLVSFDGIRGYFYRLAVTRAWRRHGIASALVAQAIAALRAAGSDRINLHVFASNAPAIGFWAGYGFSRHDGLDCWSRSWPA